ncbi:hypothetical protein GW796_09045 [archaeon]|nr:hypothetical protein [archaeon]NCT58878.1 hypothetical protein [archaeon]
MKSLYQIFEEVEALKSKEKTESVVLNAWKEIMPNSHLSYSKGSLLKNSNYSTFKGYIGKEKREFINNILENDPLNLIFSVTTKPDSITVEFSSNSLSIKPDNKYMAYGTKKLSFRKFTAKTMKDFEKKIKDLFLKVKSAIQDALENGDFDVYSDEIKEMIKSKV